MCTADAIIRYFAGVKLKFINAIHLLSANWARQNFGAGGGGWGGGDSQGEKETPPRAPEVYSLVEEKDN